jgi:MinD-like ATPase involved in chromosome partitioning or flagellar assembly
VGVIDTDIQSPGIHVLFGLSGEDVTASLNDFLWHGRDIKDAARDVTPAGLDSGVGAHRPYPLQHQAWEITRVLREGYDAQRPDPGLAPPGRRA